MIEMLESPNFRILLAFFTENCVYVGKEIDKKTAILRNEGRMQGWFSLLHIQRGIHKGKPEQPTPTERRPLYADPTKSDENTPK